MRTVLPTYAPIVLRLGLAFVFVWFGTSQVTHTSMWISLVPEWATSLSGLSTEMIVKMNGVMEIVAGTLLALGIYVRYVALLLAVHLAVVISHLGLTAIGVRDIGLSIATFALSLFGDDEGCIVRES